MPPSQLDPVITPDIDAITLKALAKDPDDRYQSAREMKADIARVLAGQQATAMVPPVASENDNATRLVPSVPVVPATQPDPDGPIDDFDDEEDEEPKNRAGLIVFIVGLAVLLVAGGAFALYNLTNGGNPGANQTPSFTPTPQVPKTTVPRVKGMNQEAATSLLTNAKLKVEVKKVAGKNDATLNTVTKQTPDDGQEVDEGSTVKIEINQGPKQVQIPDNLIGKDVDDAKKALKKLDFDVEVVDATDEPDDAKAGEVLEVDPKEGSTHDLGTTVTLTVATGESEVPTLTGRTVESATDAAKEAGFDVKVVNREDANETPDTIIDQDPEAGSMLPRGETITIYKAVMPEESSPPPSSSSPSPVRLVHSAERLAVAGGCRRRRGFRLRRLISAEPGGGTDRRSLRRAHGLSAPAGSGLVGRARGDPARINSCPGIKAVDSGAGEVPGVPSDHGQAVRQCGAGDQRVMTWCSIRNMEWSHAPRRGKIDGQDPVEETRQHELLEPSQQDAGLLGILTAAEQDPRFDLDHRHDTDRQFGGTLRRDPALHPRIAGALAQFAEDVGIQQIHQRSAGRRSRPIGSISKSMSSGISSQSARSRGVCRSRSYSA